MKKKSFKNITKSCPKPTLKIQALSLKNQNSIILCHLTVRKILILSCTQFNYRRVHNQSSTIKLATFLSFFNRLRSRKHKPNLINNINSSKPHQKFKHKHNIQYYYPNKKYTLNTQNSSSTCTNKEREKNQENHKIGHTLERLGGRASHREANLVRRRLS